jgi:hypothetical protein
LVSSDRIDKAATSRPQWPTNQETKSYSTEKTLDKGATFQVIDVLVVFFSALWFFFRFVCFLLDLLFARSYAMYVLTRSLLLSVQVEDVRFTNVKEFRVNEFSVFSDTNSFFMLIVGVLRNGNFTF